MNIIAYLLNEIKLTMRLNKYTNQSNLVTMEVVY